MTKKEQPAAKDEPAEPGDPAQEGMAHLQRAAKELIAAGHSLLDAVDELVDDPAAVGQLGDALTALAKIGAGALSGIVPNASAADPGDGDDDEPRVQRIKVT